MIPVTQQAHDLLTARVRGPLAIDATAGNGHDTEFLARLVGPEGTVWAFDIQQEALLRTACRLRERQITVELRLRSAIVLGSEADAPDGRAAPRVIGIEASHAELDEHLPPSSRGQIAAIMFNLGYLPGADQRCITALDSTLAALDAALPWMAPEGVMTVVAYPGHPGGREEAEAVREWFSKSAHAGACEWLCGDSVPWNQGPQLFAMQRTRGTDAAVTSSPLDG